MPTVALSRDELFGAIGKPFTDEEFEDLCFEFGIELDEITSEADMARKTQGNKAAEGKSAEVIYKIDVPANRYDILCLEGLARALRIFLGLDTPPRFRLAELASGSRHVIRVSPSTSSIRPFVVGAILRGITFTPPVYKSFIDLQEHLHRNICRRRTLVAIGTHDLSTIQGPFRYTADAPETIHLSPLTSEDGRVFDGKELLDFYRTNDTVKHLKPYTDIIYDSPVYPVIYDSQGIVLSLPPIINGRHSRITMETRDVFIECTATDKTKANIVLDTVVTMFSQYCSTPFTVEPVDVVYEADGKMETTPLLSTRQVETKVSDIVGLIGRELDPELIVTLCDKMQLGPSKYNPSAATVTVTVPPTRSDVLHPVDVIEDVAIAYGYNKVPVRVPPTLTVGAPLPINNFSDLIREEVARAGFIEMLTHGLCSRADNFTSLRRPEGPAVALLNPANIEYEIVRTSLLPGLLKCLQYNRVVSVKDGLKLFEISDVVLRDTETTDVGARNVRRLVASYTGLTSGFEVVHGVVDRIMTLTQIGPTTEYAGNSMKKEEMEIRAPLQRPEYQYFIHPASDPTFFPSRGAEIVLVNTSDKSSRVIGSFGILHPEVLKNYDILFPTSVVELDLEPLM